MSLPEIMVDAATREYDDEQFWEWIESGIDAGWIASPDCMTHNAVPMRAAEEDEFDDGFDPCIIVARVWKDGNE